MYSSLSASRFVPDDIVHNHTDGRTSLESSRSFDPFGLDITNESAMATIQFDTSTTAMLALGPNGNTKPATTNDSMDFADAWAQFQQQATQNKSHRTKQARPPLLCNITNQDHPQLNDNQKANKETKSTPTNTKASSSRMTRVEVILQLLQGTPQTNNLTTSTNNDTHDHRAQEKLDLAEALVQNSDLKQQLQNALAETKALQRQLEQAQLAVHDDWKRQLDHATTKWKQQAEETSSLKQELAMTRTALQQKTVQLQQVQKVQQQYAVKPEEPNM